MWQEWWALDSRLERVSSAARLMKNQHKLEADHGWVSFTKGRPRDTPACATAVLGVAGRARPEGMPEATHSETEAMRSDPGAHQMQASGCAAP